MKFKLFTIPCALLIAVSLFFTACTKEGPVGPAGPAGPAGPTGPQGSQGDTGVANVIYSDWLDVTFAPDTVHNGNVIDTVSYTAVINAPKLTNDVLSNGEIKVYVNIGSSVEPSVVPLPLDALLFQAIISPIFEVGKISLISSGDLSTRTNTSNQKTLQYRYIIIPGGTSAGTQAGGIIKKVNWENYDEAKTYLQLKD